MQEKYCVTGKTWALPATLAGGDYRLIVSMVEAGRALAQVDLGTVQVTGRPRQMNAPAVPLTLERRARPQHRLPRLRSGREHDCARHSNQISRCTGKPADSIDVSYNVFVHLLGPDGRVWAQRDSPPGQGEMATLTWVIGEYITDYY